MYRDNLISNFKNRDKAFHRTTNSHMMAYRHTCNYASVFETILSLANIIWVLIKHLEPTHASTSYKHEGLKSTTLDRTASNKQSTYAK